MVAKRIIVLACFGLLACDPQPDRARTGKNPFASAQRLDAAQGRWSGRVLERLDAGSYVYLRVERAGAQPSWVVTAEAIAPDAERVEVRALRRLDHYESKRLSRAFAPLYFAIVRKDES
jgi:hypothetical protein